MIIRHLILSLTDITVLKINTETKFLTLETKDNCLACIFYRLKFSLNENSVNTGNRINH